MNQFRKLVAITMLLATSKNQMVSLQQIVKLSKTIGDWRHNDQNSFDEFHINPKMYESLPPNLPLDPMIPKILLRPEVDIIDTPLVQEILHPVRLDIKIIPPIGLEVPLRPFLPLPPEIPSPSFLLPFPTSTTSLTSPLKTNDSAYRQSMNQNEKILETTPISLLFPEITGRLEDPMLSESRNPKKSNRISIFTSPLRDTVARTNESAFEIVTFNRTDKTSEQIPLSDQRMLVLPEVTHPPNDPFLFEVDHPKTRNSFSDLDSLFTDTALNTVHSTPNIADADETEKIQDATSLRRSFSESMHQPEDSSPFGPIDFPNIMNINAPIQNHSTNVDASKYSNAFSLYPGSWISHLSNVKQDSNLNEIVPSSSSALIDSTERDNLKIFPSLISEKKKGMLRIIPIKKGTIGKKIGTLKQIKGQRKFSSLARKLPKIPNENAPFRRVLDFRQPLK